MCHTEKGKLGHRFQCRCGCCGCGCGPSFRRFFSKEEELACLEAYAEELSLELTAVKKEIESFTVD